MRKIGKKKTVLILVIIIAAVIFCIQWNMYNTDITPEEVSIIEDYENVLSPQYCLNFIPFGEENIDNNHTNYYGVLYQNTFRFLGNKKLKGTFYSEKSLNQLLKCKHINKTELVIIRTQNSGSKLKIINESPAISTEGEEKSPDSPNWLMIMRGKFYIAGKKTKAAMDEDDKKRIAELGYEVVK